MVTWGPLVGMMRLDTLCTDDKFLVSIKHAMQGVGWMKKINKFMVSGGRRNFGYLQHNSFAGADQGK